MASLIVAAFLSCCRFTSSLGQIMPLIGMSRSHCSSNSSFMISQKLCSTQQAAIVQYNNYLHSDLAALQAQEIFLLIFHIHSLLQLLWCLEDCWTVIPQRSGFLGPRKASSASLAVGKPSVQELVVAPSHHWSFRTHYHLGWRHHHKGTCTVRSF